MTKAEQLRRVRDNYKTLLDAHAGLIAENMMNKRRIAELKERLHFNIDLGFDLEHYNVSKD